MLQAILLNKAGRSISSNEVHWRQLFSASEDSLTSTIFGILFYLPKNLFWQVLLNACYNSPISNINNIIERIEYWPRWNAKNSTNSSFIEPDIFIRTQDFDLIVEAKRYDLNQQNKFQWENEFIGYLNHYYDADKNIYLLAVGGINDEQVEVLEIGSKKCFVIKCRWGRILLEVKRLKKEIEKNENNFNYTDSLLAIIQDLIIGFRIHGYATGEWFEDTELNIKIDNLTFDFLSSLRLDFKIINWNSNELEKFVIYNSSLSYFINKK
jgi:hypothetical protein